MSDKIGDFRIFGNYKKELNGNNFYKILDSIKNKNHWS